VGRVIDRYGQAVSHSVGVTPPSMSEQLSDDSLFVQV